MKDLAMVTKFIKDERILRDGKICGVVLGQDRQYALVRHGGAYYCIHPFQLIKIHDARKPCSLYTSTKTTSSSCMSGGGSSDCVHLNVSNQSINQIDFGDNEDGVLMFERTENDIDERQIIKMEIWHNQKMISIKQWIMKVGS